jgi:hypothetical protein
MAHLEGTHERLIDTHHAAGVVKLPAVVGRGEEGHQLTLGEELVPVLHHLLNMQASHQREGRGAMWESKGSYISLVLLGMGWRI